MIKVVAFDLIGVLAGEKNIELTEIEDKLERHFGPNISDEEYFEYARQFIENDSRIINTIESIIDKLYFVKDKEVFTKLKDQFNNIKLVIATNHVSYIRKFIEKSFDIKSLDDIIISAEIHRIKPNSDFYEYILDKYHILSTELLFLDDNINNVNGAKSLGINTIKVEKDTNIYKEIINTIKNQDK